MTEPVADAAEARLDDGDRRAPDAGRDVDQADAVTARHRHVRPANPWTVVNRVGGTLLKVVSWVVLVVCGLLIVAFVLVPRIAGATPYTVLTGSMRPTMPPGTTVVVKPIPFADIQVGDVITYQISSGEPAVVTHRVIGVNVTAEGIRLETQGDANPSPDAELVREEQVRGKAWYWLPVIGYVTNGVSGDTRTWLAQGLGIALIGYAVVTLVVVAARGGKKKGAKDSGDEPVSSENPDTGNDTEVNASPQDAVYPADESAKDVIYPAPSSDSETSPAMRDVDDEPAARPRSVQDERPER